MLNRAVRLAFVAPVMLLLGCGTEHLIGTDQPPPAHALVNPLVDALPTILAVDAIELKPGVGFLLRMGINKGLIDASRRQPGVYWLEVLLGVIGVNGRIALTSQTPLDQLKTFLAEPRPDPLLGLNYSIPWNGTDGSGTVLDGPFAVEYQARVVNLRTGMTVARPIVGIVTGL